MTDDFESLSVRSGIALPPMLAQLQAEGRTRYGADRADWQANWRAYTLSAHPVLSCVYDLEWIDAAQAQRIVAEWLNPQFQHGRAFLPFAVSGAGDAYCLMRTPQGAIEVGMIWHDRGESAMEAASFEQFVFSRLVESAHDFEHLLDDFSADEARACVLANLQAVAGCLPGPPGDALRVLAAAVGPQDDDATSAVGEDAAQRASAVFAPFSSPPFVVVPRWECE